MMFFLTVPCVFFLSFLRYCWDCRYLFVDACWSTYGKESEQAIEDSRILSERQWSDIPASTNRWWWPVRSCLFSSFLQRTECQSIDTIFLFPPFCTIAREKQPGLMDGCLRVICFSFNWETLYSEIVLICKRERDACIFFSFSRKTSELKQQENVDSSLFHARVCFFKALGIHNQ